MMALKVAVNVPAGAELEVSVTVVDALAPGLSVSDELPNAALHPLGTLAARLKLAAEQLEASLLVTVNVYFLAVLAVADTVVDGETASEGLA